MTEASQVFGHLRAIDLGRGLAPAMVTKVLVALGIRVIRFEPSGGDPFDDVYPAHRAWQSAKQISTDPWHSQTCLDAIATADICAIGERIFRAWTAGRARLH